MPKHYSPQDKQIALERLLHHRGDVPRTAQELGINERTLYKWRQKADIAPPTLPPFPPISPPISEDAQAFFQDLERIMRDMVRQIAASIPPAIPDAPLNQRVAALVQLIDRILKLAAELPAPTQEVIFEGAEDEEPNAQSSSTASPSEAEGDFEF